jgi:ParB-like chromosome segregation protein Spo0J
MERGSSYWFDTADIDIDADNNGRHVLPDIKCLIESIKQDGQHTPCTVRKNGPRAMMVDGHSRWRAICEINKGRKAEDRLKVWCVYFQGNEVDALAVGFRQNRERNALTPVDEGYFVTRMLRFGRTMKDVAAICHEDESWCKQRASLVSLTPEAQEMVGDGTIKVSAAVALAKLAANEQKRMLKEGGKITASSIRRATADQSPPERKKKVTLKQIYDILHDIVGHDKYPVGISAKCSKDQLCQWLMDEIDGAEPRLAEAEDSPSA